MSDDKDNKRGEATEPEAQAAEVEDVSTRVEDAPPEAAREAPREEPPAAAPPPRRAGFSAVAWLALLLVLALGAGAAWSLLEAQRREASLLERLAALESLTEREVLDAAEQQAEIRAYGRELEQGLRGDLSQQLGSLKPELAQQASRLAELREQLQAMESRIEGYAEKLNSLGTRDRESWLLAEVEYLLRLANQRLIMTSDVASAQALLSSADGVLRELDDVGLYPVRRAVAEDLAALRAVPRQDIEGLYLRLSALGEAAAELAIFELPEAEERIEPEPPEDWQGRLRHGWEAALDKLSDYIIVRRRDAPMQALMDPQWERLVRQNLRMLLEQSQVALLSGNALLYRESLERARHWVQQFFESDAADARAIDRELAQLAGATINAEMPDISRSLEALNQATAAANFRGEDG